MAGSISEIQSRHQRYIHSEAVSPLRTVGAVGNSLNSLWNGRGFNSRKFLLKKTYNLGQSVFFLSAEMTNAFF